MPFTFSHPAIVVPLGYLPKKWVSMTGLVAGSMAPDFEYFLRMKIKGYHGHEIAGVFWFDLPLAIAMAFIFHDVVRNTLFDNLPVGLKSRLVAFRDFNWNEHFRKQWPVVLICMAIGSLSHIFWDGFTHRNGYFVEMLPVLKTKVMLGGAIFPWYRILQHTSTILGGVVITVAIVKLKRQYDTGEHPILFYWLVVSAIALLVIIVRATGGLSVAEYGNVVVTLVSGVMIGLIVSPLLVRPSK